MPAWPSSLVPTQVQLSREFANSLLSLDKQYRPRIVECIYTLANGVRLHHYPDSVASPHAREDLRGMIHVQRANGPLYLVWSVDVDRASCRCAHCAVQVMYSSRLCTARHPRAVR